MTSQQIIHQVIEALSALGSYNFRDKGPHEVMNLDGIVTELNAMPVEECERVMMEVWNSPDRQSYCRSVVHCIITDMQVIDDARWDRLMENKTLLAAFDGDE
jgi:hypothetical protein